MYLSVKKVCERYGVARSTINKWAGEGKFPQPEKINGVTRWSESALNEWDRKRNAK